MKPNPARSGITLLVRIFILLCFVLPPAVAPAQQTSPRVTAAELDKVVYAFADRYATRIMAATDAVLRDNPSPEQRRLAHQIKLAGVSGIYDISTNAEPFSKLMDLLMVVTLQSYCWIDEDQAERAFGARGMPLIRAIRTLRVDIWNIAGRVLRQEQLQQLDALILDWRRRNPNVDGNPKVDILSYLRFDEVAKQHGPNTLNEIKATGFFAEIAEATKVADEARLLAERAFYQAKRMPFLVTWQMESLMNDALNNPEFSKSLKVADSLAHTADRALLAVEKLPQQVSKEREAIVAAFEDRSGRLTGLMGEVRKTTVAADQLAVHVNQVAESSERLTVNLRDTANGVTETWRAVDQLLSKHAELKEIKSFQISPYVTVSTELNQTVAGLNNLLGMTDTLISKRPWAAPAQDFNAMIGAQIDHVFWRALMLICAFFVLLFTYRWATARWLKAA